MDHTLRQIVRHAGVFGIGAILSRLASVVLLPLYTHYLQPADYGVIAIIDLTVNLLGIAGGAGIASAATREHFQSPERAHLDRVWWTALAMVGALTTVVFVPTLISRDQLARLAFGDSIGNGAYYLAIAIPTMWIGVLTYVFEAYFRAQKASVFLVSIGLGRLLLNILLNVVFLAWFHLGVPAILWGNLLAAAITCLVEAAVFARARGAAAFDRRLTRQYWSFGWPIMLFGLLSSLMHEADRFILRIFASFGDVGLYSIAYQIGQGINSLIIMPFITIWSVMIYEVAKHPDAEQVYARVFKNFAMGLALVLLLASLFAAPILRVVAPPEYGPAAPIVPIVCLAYFFFSLHEHFKVPALIRNRTVALLPVVSLSVAINIVTNLALIPRYGGTGAAWASVLTFVVFSGLGLLQYRRIARYPYPFAACSAVVCGMVASYVGYRALAARLPYEWLQLVLAAGIWLVWAASLFGGTARDYYHKRGTFLGGADPTAPRPGIAPAFGASDQPASSSDGARPAMAGLKER